MLSKPYWSEADEIQQEIMADPHYSKIVTALRNDPDSQIGFSLVQDRLFYKGRLVISKDSKWVPIFLHEFHSSPVGDWLSWAEYWYNTSYQGSTGSTPFELVYGRKPPTILRFLPGECLVEAVANDLSNRDEILKQLQFNLQKAQQIMCSYANKKRRDINFGVGDWVYLKLRPQRQITVAKRICPKLSPRYFGPFQILGRVGKTAYKLKLPENSRVHPVFHVSQLKAATGQLPADPEIPIELEQEIPVVEPEEFLKHRTIHRNNQDVPQVLVKWKNQPLSEATWEDEVTIRGQFPEIILEDKAVSTHGGIDREETVGPEMGGPTPLRVYVRRGVRNEKGQKG
ncbi:hypothetical protein L6164_037408 [Bauhinia variegata]|uniref:Uncharacterized protein n=1 Tax=Bauhinia variegata TaxID=167791 RepID=A0ACB9KK56_BAUVA|nr:hypothetical protein L6164_037408 [Bauhinia variegata]